MQIVEFAHGTLRFLERVPEQQPENGFIWIILDRDKLAGDGPALQAASQALGGSQILDLHLQDLANADHPSHYDSTSIYDLVIFRRLATEAETPHAMQLPTAPQAPLASF